MALKVELVRQRLRLLDGYVASLREFQHRTLEQLASNQTELYAVEHLLQLAIQCVIDVCLYLVAGLNLGTVTTSIDAAEKLAQANLIPVDFSLVLGQMMKFRNILVHVYANVDVERVYLNLSTGLGDFERFSHLVEEQLKMVEAQAASDLSK